MIGLDAKKIEDDDKILQALNDFALPSEIDYIKKSSCLKVRKQRTTALICVKNAVKKALGLDENEYNFKDIELSHEESGKPFVILHGKALEKFERDYKGKSVEISISHTQNTAIAVATLSN